MATKTVYEMVTDRIINRLEHGVTPWEKPQIGIKSGAYNRISKKPYSLLNQMLLKHEAEYATFKQWQDLDGHVRKGEKSEIVVFWEDAACRGRTGRRYKEHQADTFTQILQCKSMCY